MIDSAVSCYYNVESKDYVNEHLAPKRAVSVVPTPVRGPTNKWSAIKYMYI